MRRNNLSTSVGMGCLALMTAWLLATPVAAGDGEKSKIKTKDQKVVVHKDSKAAHGSGEHKVVFVGDDGQRHEFSSHGEGYAFVHGGKGGFLGVQLTDLTPELRAHFGVAEDAGVMVSKVVEGSPAFRAGLQVGDIVTAVDGEKVASGGALARAIGSREPGALVTIEAWRGGRLQTLTATLDKGEAHKMAKRIVVKCPEGEDCAAFAHAHAFDCGGAETCEVKVQCKDGQCDCTVNGQATDCGEIPGVHAHGE